jgi:hypothetical protein
MKQPASAFHEASSAPTAGLMDAIRKTDYLDCSHPVLQGEARILNKREV